MPPRRMERVGWNTACIIVSVTGLHILSWFVLWLIGPYPFNYSVWRDWFDVLYDLLVGPLLEESVFRLLPIYLALRLRAARRHLVAVGIVTSIIFGSLHPTPDTVVLHMISGAVYFALFFVNHRSYTSPVVAHASYNLSANIIGWIQLET
jgi:membrane protease YdiL (CAAX protease family)